VKVILTQLARSTAGGGEGGERRVRFDFPLHDFEVSPKSTNGASRLRCGTSLGFGLLRL